MKDSQDVLARCYVALSSLRKNLGQMTGYLIPERYVKEFHSVLDRLENIGIEVSEFRIPESLVEPRITATLSDGSRSFDKPFILTKLDAIIGYLGMLCQVSNKKQKVGVIIAAGGSSNRMGGLDKLYAVLGGKPVLLWATHAFQKSPLIDQIVVVVAGEKVNVCQQLIPGGEWSKVTNICAGGERRQDSVAAGLKLIGKCDWVVIHDGARPFITTDLIERGLAAAQETGAAIAAVPVTDTIKEAGEDSIVRQTLPRQNLWAIQTPQVFRIDIITEAYRRAKGDVTDDAMLVEQMGYKVKVFMGSYDNIKITTPEDLALAEVLVKKYG